MYIPSRLSQNRSVTPSTLSLRRRYQSSLALLALSCLLPVSCLSQTSATRQSKLPPDASHRVGAKSARTVSSEPTSTPKNKLPGADEGAVELQRRIDAEKAAVISGDPQAVVDAARKLASLELQRVASLRMLVHSYPQAVELYRKSLALEDVPQTRLGLASAALAANQPDEAIAQTTKLLQAEPEDSRLWYLNGKSWMAKQDYRSAVESLKRSLALRKDVNTQYALARAYLELNDIPSAEKVFKQMLAEQGDRPIWHVIVGGAYRESGYGPEAIVEFRRALAMDPRVHHAHLYLALTLLEQSGWSPTDESTKQLKEAVRQDPKDFYANLYMGFTESRADHMEESNKHLKYASELNPGIAELWLYLGLNAFKQNNFSEAKPYLLKAVELTGKNEAQGEYEIRRAYIALGRIEFMAGNTEQAKKYSEKVKDLKGKSMSEDIAEISGMGAPAAPIPHANLPEKDLLADAGPVDPTAQLETAALAKSSLSDADKKQLQEIERGLRVLLSNCYNDWGTANARQGLYGVALDHFHEAEQWDNSTPGLMRNVGLAALRVGDQAEAARALRIAVEANPGDVQARARLAMSLFATDQYEEAVKQFDIIGDPLYSDQAMNYAWGYSLVRIGGHEKKGVEVLNHLVLHPLPPDLLLSVGDLYSVVEDYEHAITCYKRALEIEPTIARAHYKMGASLIRLSRMPEAVSELQAELKTTPGDVDVRYNLAYALLENSQKEPALQILRALVADSPNHPQAHYLLGKTLLEEGQLQDSVQHLEIAAKLDPESDYVHYQLQLAYRRSGRTEDADREAKIYKGIKTRKRESVVIPMPERKQ